MFQYLHSISYWYMDTYDSYLSLESCEIGATPHTVGNVLTVKPRSHGNLLLLLSMLPKGLRRGVAVVDSSLSLTQSLSLSLSLSFFLSSSSSSTYSNSSLNAFLISSFSAVKLSTFLLSSDWTLSDMFCSFSISARSLSRLVLLCKNYINARNSRDMLQHSSLPWLCLVILLSPPTPSHPLPTHLGQLLM